MSGRIGTQVYNLYRGLWYCDGPGDKGPKWFTIAHPEHCWTHRASISPKIRTSFLKFDSNSVPCLRYSSHSITTKFCICHDSTAVVACTKFRFDSVASISLVACRYLGFINLKCPNSVVKCIRFYGTKETHVCKQINKRPWFLVTALGRLCKLQVSYNRRQWHNIYIYRLLSLPISSR